MLLQFPKPLPCLFWSSSCIYISGIGPRLRLPHIYQGIPFPGVRLGFVPQPLSSWFNSSKSYNGKALFIYFSQILFLSNVPKSLWLGWLSRQCSGKRKKKIMRSPYTLWSTGDLFFFLKFSVQQNVCFVLFSDLFMCTPQLLALQMQFCNGYPQDRTRRESRFNIKYYNKIKSDRTERKEK